MLPSLLVSFLCPQKLTCRQVGMYKSLGPGFLWGPACFHAESSPLARDSSQLVGPVEERCCEQMTVETREGRQWLTPDFRPVDMCSTKLQLPEWQAQVQGQRCMWGYIGDFQRSSESSMAQE